MGSFYISHKKITPVSLKNHKEQRGLSVHCQIYREEKSLNIIGHWRDDQHLEALVAFTHDLDRVERTYSFAHNHYNHSSWRANTIL